MPFIRGRYHMNPIMGQALEAAREAEAALRARQNSNNNAGDDDSYADDATGFRSTEPAAKGPVHHVEIDAAEVVPNHSGRATRGFVVRVHHTAAVPQSSAGDSSGGDASDANGWRDSRPGVAPAPETHVFADHGDLVDFLRDALASAPDDGAR